MTDKILVTYASRTGATAGVAEAIGKTLAEGGAAVDVLPMSAVSDLAPYRAVVMGSAIQGHQWLPEAMQFVRTHQAALAHKPCATFLVCITLAIPSAAQYRSRLSEWMQPVRRLVNPVSEGYFAGRLDFGKMPLSMATLQFRIAAALGFIPRGDHRDWTAIQAWAAGLRPRLLH